MSRKDFIILVSELNIDYEIKSKILDHLQKGQTESAMLSLQKYRRTLLSELHTVEEKLYQIDFVLRKA